jgi:hypothetical protein
MRATVMFGAGDVRIENVPDARLVEPTDTLVRVTRAYIEEPPAGRPRRQDRAGRVFDRVTNPTGCPTAIAR